MYTHMVIFDLQSGKNSEKTDLFLSDAKLLLSAIPVVKNFKVSRQVSPKNDYAFCFSMDFDSEVDFQTYVHHPNHSEFVSKRWHSEVTRFLEIDLTENELC